MIIRVSSVSYFNSAPFVYGLTHGDISKRIELTIDNPAECARKLLGGIVDVGLVPVAIIPQSESFRIISDYCIGSNGGVQTVALFSHNPLGELDTIYVDDQSRTSAKLVRVLAQNFWRCDFNWQTTDVMKSFRDIKANEGLVAIGDKVFEIQDAFKYNLDLASEWYGLTGLPFVFATWVANRELPPDFTDELNRSLQLGLNSISQVVAQYAPSVYTALKAHYYLSNSISYHLTDEKRKAMDLFWTLSKGMY